MSYCSSHIAEISQSKRVSEVNWVETVLQFKSDTHQIVFQTKSLIFRAGSHSTWEGRSTEQQGDLYQVTRRNALEHGL